LTKTWEQALISETGYTSAELTLTNRKSLTRCEISLQAADESTTCTNALQWYDVDATFTDGSSNGFTYVAEGGIITKTCPDSSIGSSASTINYSIFIAENGVDYVESARFRSVATFASNENTKAVGTNGVSEFVMSQGSKAKVMVRSSTAGVTIDHQTINVTAFEV